jgi:hypothetical protein
MSTSADFYAYDRIEELVKAELPVSDPIGTSRYRRARSS